MSLLSNVIRRLRGVVEKEEEKEEYSGGFLPFRVRGKALSLLKDGTSLLDLGCGEGLLLYHISKSHTGKKLYGIDPWEGILDKAIDKVDASFLIGDGNKLPFKDSSFDEITILNLLYNLSGPVEVKMLLKEAHRVCKKNGKIIFDYRNRNNPLIWHGYRTVKEHDPDIKVPVNAYTRREIREFIKSAGAGKTRYYSIPQWWIVNSPAYLVEVCKKC